jgi:hypothetical protein
VAAAALALRPAPASAKGEDKGLLEVMVAYQQAVVFAYEVALRNAPLDARERATLRGFRDEAETAAAALRRALTDNGGTPPAQRSLAFAKLPPKLARQAGRDGLIRSIGKAEDNAMSGWFVGLQKFTEPRLLTGSAALMKAAGRRLVTLRDSTGEPPLPRAFETGTP